MHLRVDNLRIPIKDRQFQPGQREIGRRILEIPDPLLLPLQIKAIPDDGDAKAHVSDGRPGQLCPVLQEGDDAERRGEIDPVLRIDDGKGLFPDPSAAGQQADAVLDRGVVDA